MSGAEKSDEEARKIAEAERTRRTGGIAGLGPEATVAGRVPGVPSGSLPEGVEEFDQTSEGEKLGSDGAARDRRIAREKDGH